MVDKFDLSRVQPQKEWWRERPVAPATFFGFPDVSKHGLRGGSLYVEQMDSVTLAVLADKCLKEKIVDPEIWTKFSWRAQQMASRTHEPDICYIFRAFARADWFDQNLLTTYLGRLHRRLHAFHLPDVAVLLEAFANPRFRQSTYLQKTLLHLALLLQHRDDAKAGELARCCAALRALRPLPEELSSEVLEALELLAEALLLRDLSELNPSRAILVIDAYVAWGLLSRERDAQSNASTDLCWALVRELKGRLRAHGRERPDDLAALALALGLGRLDHDDLWKELVHNLEYEAHRLSGAAVAQAVFGAARAGRCSGKLFEVLARRLGEECRGLSPEDCVRAAGGFLRGPAAVAERVVLRGPLAERILGLGLSAFRATELVALLDALSRASPGTWGVEALAGAVLEALHGRLDELSLESLASVVRSLGYLRPESPKVLAAVLDKAQAALAASPAPAPAPASEEASSAEEAAAAAAAAPRHLAMLCQGVAQQPRRLLPDAGARLEALLPHLEIALASKPTAVTAATVLGSLVRCPGSPLRSTVLDACAARLASGAHDLTASALVSLSVGVAAVAVDAAGASGGAAWSPPPALVQKLGAQLDIKRYDLPPGALGRASQALEAVGGPEAALRLEPRDVARPAS